MENNFLIQIADDVAKSLAKKQSGTNKPTPSTSLRVARVISIIGGYHTVAIRNADGTDGDTYQNIASQDGTIYALDTVVNLYFGKVSPLPKIVGVSSNTNSSVQSLVSGIVFFFSS